MEEVKNKEDLDIVFELFTPDFVLHLPGAQLRPGPESRKAVGKSVFSSFTKVHVTVNDTVVEGDRVVERHTAHAVDSSEFNGVPATGKNVFWTQTEAWSEVSFHHLMAQITTPEKAAMKA